MRWARAIRCGAATMLAAACGLALADRAAAGTASGRLTVTATVVSACRVSTSSLDFGAYDPDGANADAPLEATGSVTLMCSYGSAPVVTIDRGQSPAGAYGTSRAMSHGADHLGYEIYSDPGRTRVWTESDAGTTTPAPGGSRVELYGRIPPGQKVPPGPYQDIVRVRVDF